MEKANKIKKYLFYISIFFVFMIWTHIANLYLYHNAEIKPTEWWNISEGFIWDFPHLNPLINSNNYNNYIVSLLYRSLLTYDQENNKIIWDIAKCDIKDLQYVECYLNENVKWSNWSNITVSDIITTYKIIKDFNLNPNLNSILENTTIEERAWVITFSNRKENINFINLLFQPIVSKEILDSLSESQLSGNFDPSNWLYSNKYIINSIDYDDASKVRKLNLTKNDMYYQNDSLISRIILKFFKDVPHFLKYKDSVNLFLDKDNIVSWSIPRLEEHGFILPQYFSAFINKEKIKDISLREILLNQIDTENILSILWKWYKWVKNPYLSEVSIEIKNEKSTLEDELSKLWYYKSNKLVEKNLEKEEIDKIKAIFDEENTKSIYIVTEWINYKYNFISSDDILLKWNINSKTPSAIYINDYRLTWYKQGNKEFFYRLKKNFLNIKEWLNKYKVEFEFDWEKETIEEFSIIYYEDTNKLEEEKQKIIENYKPIVKEINQDEVNKNEIAKKEEEDVINDLDENFYYNSENEKYSLNLIYLDSQKEWQIIANNIKLAYENIWIIVNIEPISINTLNEMLSSWNKDYDIILIWINLWYFDFNIFPYFHSSQVKNWYNFANIKKPWLDYVLEDLKSKILSDSKIEDLKVKVLELLKEEQVIKTIFTPVLYNLVDNNIKNYKLEEFIPSSIVRKNSIYNAYVKSEKNINFEEKSFSNFLSFITQILKKND